MRAWRRRVASGEPTPIEQILGEEIERE